MQVSAITSVSLKDGICKLAGTITCASDIRLLVFCEVPLPCPGVELPFLGYTLYKCYVLIVQLFCCRKPSPNMVLVFTTSATRKSPLTEIPVKVTVMETTTSSLTVLPTAPTSWQPFHCCRVVFATGQSYSIRQPEGD